MGTPTAQERTGRGTEWLDEPGTLVLKEWMWHEEGLGLRIGSIKLTIYSLVYGAHQSGRGLLASTQRNIASYLQVGHASVERAFKELIEDELIDVRGVMFNPRGGKAIPTYSINVPAAQRAIDALTHIPGDCPPGIPIDKVRFAERLEEAAQKTVESAPEKPSGGVNALEGREETTGRSIPQIEGLGKSFQQSAGRSIPQIEGNRDNQSLKMRATPQNEGNPYIENACAEEERDICISKNDIHIPPAEMREGASAGKGCISEPLSESESAILARVIRETPKRVQKRFQKSIERDFASLIRDHHIPAEAILDAHERYCKWHRQRYGADEAKAIPLTSWLRPMADGKLNSFLLNAKDCHEAAAAAAEETSRKQAARKFTKCRDMGTATWYANHIELSVGSFVCIELFALRGLEDVTTEQLEEALAQELAQRREQPARAA